MAAQSSDRRHGRVIVLRIRIDVAGATASDSLTQKIIQRAVIGAIHGALHHHHQIASGIEIRRGERDVDIVLPAWIAHVSIENKRKLGGWDIAGAEVLLSRGAQSDFGGAIGVVGIEVIVKLNAGDGPIDKTQFVRIIQGLKQ